MKIKFIISQIDTLTVCVPSNDFYSRSNDFMTEEIKYLRDHYQIFDTEELAISKLNELLMDSDSPNDKFIIQKVYSK